VREVPGVEIFLFVFVDGVAGDAVHDDPEGVVPVAAVALKPDMDIVDVDDGIVDDANEVLLGEGLLLAALGPLLLHLHLYAVDHAAQQFGGVDGLLHLLVADVQQHVNALHLHHRVLLLEGSPGDVDVDLFDVAELQREGQAQLIYEGRL